jgi:hypothetical protein
MGLLVELSEEDANDVLKMVDREDVQKDLS